MRFSLNNTGSASAGRFAITISQSTLSLDRLRSGDRALVTELAGEAAITIRLLEMGVLVGETVTVIGVAPLGDPITIQLRGGRLAIRRRDAALVHVARIHGDD